MQLLHEAVNRTSTRTLSKATRRTSERQGSTYRVTRARRYHLELNLAAPAGLQHSNSHDVFKCARRSWRDWPASRMNQFLGTEGLRRLHQFSLLALRHHFCADIVKTWSEVEETALRRGPWGLLMTCCVCRRPAALWSAPYFQASATVEAVKMKGFLRVACVQRGSLRTEHTQCPPQNRPLL